jgi:kynurenine formamidase
VRDCVFLYTGHGNIWHPKDWDTYDAAEKSKRVAQCNAGEPGLGISACEYLAQRKVILTGADNWAVKAVGKGFGGENPQPFECHIKLQTKRGIWNMENLNLNQLVADKAYEFLVVWSPLKMKGATGSPGNPVALYYRQYLADAPPPTNRRTVPAPWRAGNGIGGALTANGHHDGSGRCRPVRKCRRGSGSTA